MAAHIAASRARDPAAVRRLLASTGSTIDPAGTAVWARLVRNPPHVAGPLAMMAAWHLDAMPHALRALAVPTLLVVGGNDRTVPPEQAERVDHRRSRHGNGSRHAAHPHAAHPSPDGHSPRPALMTGTPRVRIVSFDLDGTLVDTAGEIAEAANRTVEEFGLPRRPVAEMTKLIGAGTKELMLGLLRRIAADPATADVVLDQNIALDRFAHHYAMTSGTTCRAYPTAQDALVRLRAAGVRLACVTNKEERYSRQVLAACAMQDAFDLLVGGDTLAVKKPDARVLLHAIATLGGTRDSMAHVGDSRTDVEAARNAGVAAWFVPYGYNQGEPIEHARPDRVFRDLGEVAAYVLG